MEQPQSLLSSVMQRHELHEADVSRHGFGDIAPLR
jgi:hypothetical protein